MSNQPNRWRSRILRYAPLILWTALIFLASTSTGSTSNTSRFIRPLLEWLFPNTPEETFLVYHGYIRKLAHFGEYAVLAFWASLAFKTSSKAVLRSYWFAFAFAFVVGTALIDEFNQSLNLQRTGTIYDVLLDAAGGVAMILFISGVEYARKNR